MKITQEQMVTQWTSHILIATKVLMTLWPLGNQESFRKVAERFGVNKGVIFYVSKQIIETWADLAADLIRWPMQLQAQAVVGGTPRA